MGLADVDVKVVVGQLTPAGTDVKVRVPSNMGGARVTVMVMVEPGVAVVGSITMLVMETTCRRQEGCRQGEQHS